MTSHVQSEVKQQQICITIYAKKKNNNNANINLNSLAKVKGFKTIKYYKN